MYLLVNRGLPFLPKLPEDSLDEEEIIYLVFCLVILLHLLRSLSVITNAL